MHNFRGRKMTTREITITLYFYQPTKMVNLIPLVDFKELTKGSYSKHQLPKCIPNKKAPKLTFPKVLTI